MTLGRGTAADLQHEPARPERRLYALSRDANQNDSQKALERMTRSGNRLAGLANLEDSHRALERNRTVDLILTMDVLYRLSYKGVRTRKKLRSVNIAG